MHLIFIDRDQTAGAKHGLRRNTAPEIANWLASRIETTNDFSFDSFFHRLLNIRERPLRLRLSISRHPGDAFAGSTSTFVLDLKARIGAHHAEIRGIIDPSDAIQSNARQRPWNR
jgi:hypothetical protein